MSCTLRVDVDRPMATRPNLWHNQQNVMYVMSCIIMMSYRWYSLLMDEFVTLISSTRCLHIRVDCNSSNGEDLICINWLWPRSFFHIRFKLSNCNCVYNTMGKQGRKGMLVGSWTSLLAWQRPGITSIWSLLSAPPLPSFLVHRLSTELWCEQ